VRLRLRHENIPGKAAADVYEALTGSEGLSQCWTQADSDPRVGGQAAVRFGSDDSRIVRMAYTRLQPDPKSDSVRKARERRIWSHWIRPR
jgi:hypothetical protein